MNQLKRNHVTIYGRGVRLESPQNPRKRGSGAARGEISKLSSASSRRFRHFLVIHEPVYPAYPITLTVPGDRIISRPEWACVVARWRTLLHRSGCGFVWRLHITRRGQPHLHGLLLHPSIDDWRDMRVWASLSWCVALGDLASDAASEHACDVGPNDGLSWYRYMIDHASSGRRRGQEAVGWGRHWGVFGRKHFRQSSGYDLELTDQQYSSIMRWLGRLSSPRVSCPHGPFPDRLRRRWVGRLRDGSHVSFSAPATVERMLDYLLAWGP